MPKGPQGQKRPANVTGNAVLIGKVKDVSEAGAGLRRFEERKVQLSTLRWALEEGETSGLSTAFDFDAFIASKRGAAER
jgi:antitoxin ParD1/3/4